MPAISRDLIDLAKTGHGCTPVIPVKATQNTVFANGKAMLRPGDPCLPHTILVPCPPSVCCVFHLAVVWGSSPNVFAEGRPISRKYDGADRGSMIMGSPNVFANGAGGLAGAIIGSAVSAGVGSLVSGIPSPGSTGPGGSDVMGST
tara:strand:- start:790 stop:1227 length:438 start_codon:yes stop_codon:yes gene_type:complete